MRISGRKTMNNYTVTYSKTAKKQRKNIREAKLDKKVLSMIERMMENPYQYSDDFEILKGDKKGLYSRRINLHHRIVYSVDEEHREIFILSLWSHYEY